jgi:outer membrane protein TolC
MIARALLCAGCLILAAGPGRADQPQRETPRQAARKKVEAAQAAVDIWQERVTLAQRMVANGYLTQDQYRADLRGLIDAEVSRRMAVRELEELAPESLTGKLGWIAKRYQIAKSEVDRTRAHVNSYRDWAERAERMVQQGRTDPFEFARAQWAVNVAEHIHAGAVERLKAITGGK